MGCNCRKKRRTTAWGSGTTPPRPARNSEPQVSREPVSLELPSGKRLEFTSAIEAYSAQMKYGGKIVTKNLPNE